MRLLIASILVLFAVTTCVSAQGSVSKKKKELKSLRSSIQSTQKKLDRLGRKEKSTKSSLNKYERRRHETTVFIKQLEDDLVSLRDSGRSEQYW